MVWRRLQTGPRFPWLASCYAPLWRSGGERIAFNRVERHNKTNEVFILTSGQADLIIMDGDDSPTTAHVFPMRLNVAYNIAQSVWHHVVMSEGCTYCAWSNVATQAVDNSDYAQLTPDVISVIRDQFTL